MKTLQISYRRPGRQVSRRVNRQGFNLVEVTLTILILGILIAVASPVYSKSLFRFRAESAAQRIAKDIEQAQQLARQTNTACNVVFRRLDSSYTLEGTVSMEQSRQPYSVALSQYPYLTSINSLTTSTDPSTSLTELMLTFDRFGAPDQGISITVQSGDIQKQIVMTAITGRVSIP
jgi:prepilin-type N-terminal cleavage/methylation domain-containing protein